MPKVPPNKMQALMQKGQQSKKSGPPKKPGGGKPPPFQKHGGDHEDDDDDDKDHEHHEPDGDEVDVQAIADRIDNDEGDEHLMDLTDGYDPDQGDPNPPEWVEDEDIWEKAKKAVEPHEDQYDNKWAVVAHVYEAMGGSVKG